jgi:hypothetical protein
MRNAHIVKQSVLGDFGVKFYVKNCEANLSIGSTGSGEAQDSLSELCEHFASFAVKSSLYEAPETSPYEIEPGPTAPTEPS